MKKKGIVKYKYNASAKSSLILGPLSLILMVAVAALLIYWIHFLFIFVAIFSAIVLFNLAGLNKCIVLDSKFMIIGDRIIWYHNIEKVYLNKNGLTLKIIVNDSIDCTISYANFPTAAHKPDKITKNKVNKFFKVSNKIIEKVKTIVPMPQIVID
jgi:hypothetical protein